MPNLLTLLPGNLAQTFGSQIGGLEYLRCESHEQVQDADFQRKNDEVHILMSGPDVT